MIIVPRKVWPDETLYALYHNYSLAGWILGDYRYETGLPSVVCLDFVNQHGRLRLARIQGHQLGRCPRAKAFRTFDGQNKAVFPFPCTCRVLYIYSNWISLRRNVYMIPILEALGCLHRAEEVMFGMPGRRLSHQVWRAILTMPSAN